MAGGKSRDSVAGGKAGTVWRAAKQGRCGGRQSRTVWRAPGDRRCSKGASLVQAMLADQYTIVAAGRALVRDAAAAYDSGADRRPGGPV